MTSTLRVLLVDSHGGNRELLIRAIQGEHDNPTVEEILDEHGFEQSLTKGNFDVVITESALRWTDGISVLKVVKSRFPDCPVIMWTASGNEELAVEAMKGGLDDYLVKNHSQLERLSAAVNSALEPSPTRRRIIALEYRLQSLFERLNVGVFRCTPQWKLLEWNAAFLKLLTPKSSDEKTVALAFEALRKRSPSDRLFDQIQETGQPVTFDVKWKRQGESSLRLAVNVATAKTEKGAVVVDGLIEDVTAKVRIEVIMDERAAVGARLSLLSPRERDVLKLVVAGKTNKGISQDLGISQKTVEMHRGKLMKKLRVNSVAELVRLVVSAGPAESPEL